MNDNTFWACGAVVAITFIVSIHLSNINTTEVKLEEHKAATAAGLQQLMSYQKIWVKVKE